MLEALEREPTLRHLAWHVGTCLASHHGLESHGQVWGEAHEGLSQGDPEVSTEFRLGCIQKSVKWTVSFGWLGVVPS